jgi:hypothetical protein
MVKKEKGFENWVTTPEAAKISGFTKGAICLKIKMGQIKKVRRVGKAYLVNIEEIRNLKRTGRGPASQYQR